MKWPILSYFLIFFLLSGCGSTTDKIDAPNAVTDLRSIEIGGMQQWVLIRGEDKNYPILLWLHGGPGSAQMPIHHAYTKELEKEFIVVHWDQRGAGKSNHRGFVEETMTLNRFILDVHELTQYLKERFDQEKIYLLGHSWGTLLGVLTIDRYPEDYSAFISVAQVVHSARAEKISYQWLREKIKREASEKDNKIFEQLGGPPFRDHERYVRFAKLKDEFGGGMDAKFTELLWNSLGAEEYSFLDLIRWLKGANRGSGPMWEETNSIDLLSAIDTVMVPVHFLTGTQDYNTPHELVKEFYQFLIAPHGKFLIPFDNSAHTPFIAESDRFVKVMRQVKYQTERLVQ